MPNAPYNELDCRFCELENCDESDPRCAYQNAKPNRSVPIRIAERQTAPFVAKDTSLTVQANAARARRIRADKGRHEMKAKLKALREAKREMKLRGSSRVESV